MRKTPHGQKNSHILKSAFNDADLRIFIHLSHISFLPL